MYKRSAVLLIAIATLGVASCSRILEKGGTRTALAVEIQFEDADHRPVVAAPVYVVETVGTMQPITEVLTTNGQGRVKLEGQYCLPAVVAVKGGNVTLHPETLSKSYVVPVSRGDSPSVERLFGAPSNEFLDWSRKHGDCG